MFSFPASFERPWLHSPFPFASSMPSRAQNSFHAQSFLVFVSTTLPTSIVRSFGSAPTLAATFLKRSSRAAWAARSVAGACEGQVVLPPDPLEKPYWLSPSFTMMSVGMQAEDFGRDDGRDGPLGGAEVLRARSRRSRGRPCRW